LAGTYLTCTLILQLQTEGAANICPEITSED